MDWNYYKGSGWETRREEMNTGGEKMIGNAELAKRERDGEARANGM